MSEIFISPELEKHFSKDEKVLFDKVFHLEGEDFRLVKARRTFRFELEGRGYFAKVHHGIGWKEIIKDLIQFKMPILGAENEYRAIRHLESIGVPTMRCAAFGRRGINPARQESFIITDELKNMASVAYKDERNPKAPAGAETENVYQDNGTTEEGIGLIQFYYKAFCKRL